MTPDSSPHSDRLADIRLKWVQTYNATTDNDPRTAAMRGDIRWLVEQLRTEQREHEEMTAQFVNEAIHLTRAEGRIKELEEQNEALRDALERCGDLLFGTWDDDQERIAQMRIAEARTRAVLFDSNPASEPEAS